MDDWQEQTAWLESEILKGQQASRAKDVLQHIDADKMKQFRQRVRILFDEVDLDANQALDLEELRLALTGFGLHFTDDSMRSMMSFMDTDKNGIIDYNEFENGIIEIFFGRPEGGIRPAWQQEVMSRMDSRLRPPPPARPRSMENRVGSVKSRDECLLAELHGQQIGETMWDQHALTLEDDHSTVTLHISCANLTTVRDRLTRKATYPAFPSRPVVCLNIQEPLTKVYFAASHTNWLDGVVHPFQKTVSFEYFESLHAMELVAYDLEMAGDSQSAQMYSGTAMIGVVTVWVPGSHKSKETQLNTFPRGSLHVQVMGARRLPKADVFGLSDPYAVLKCGHEKFQTHTELCTLDPEWGDEFEFHLQGDHGD
jgi:hypothetical protein